MGRILNTQSVPAGREESEGMREHKQEGDGRWGEEKGRREIERCIGKGEEGKGGKG